MRAWSSWEVMTLESRREKGGEMVKEGRREGMKDEKGNDKLTRRQTGATKPIPYSRSCIQS